MRILGRSLAIELVLGQFRSLFSCSLSFPHFRVRVLFFLPSSIFSSSLKKMTSRVAASWDSAVYLLHQELRTRPAKDLLARARHYMSSRKDEISNAELKIVDFGCGPGNSTRPLSEAFPTAQVTGIDSAEDMLATARKQTPESQYPNVTYVNKDIGKFLDEEAPAEYAQSTDLVFSNALFQWIEGHERRFERMVRDWLKPGGVLAIQMPKNFASPSHALLRQVACDTETEWGSLLQNAVLRHPVADPAEYFRILHPHCSIVDIWETEYLQVLQGKDPVLEWTRGTALVPIRAALAGHEKSAELLAKFESRYAEALRKAYPPDENGNTLFPFKRIFIVAVAKHTG